VQPEVPHRFDAQQPIAQQPMTISVRLTQPFTDTGLYLKQGQSVSVSARGTMNWYTGACNGKCLSTPAGIPCPGGGAKRLGLTCLSLIGRVGPAGRPFDVGESLTFTAPTSGEFLLGVNDNYLPDNTGEWIATLSSPTAFARAPWPAQAAHRAAVLSGNCKFDRQASISAEDAVTRGQQAFENRKLQAAGCWWRVAAERGHPDGQFFLGIWYEYGQGGITDHGEAMRWLNNAAGGGHVQARDYLVCTSAKVEEAMIDLLADSAGDSVSRNMNFLGAILLGMEETAEHHRIVDMSPGDFSKDDHFSCTATLHAIREIREALPNSDGEKEVVVPKAVESLIPFVQTYEITNSGEGKYLVTLPYAGALSTARFKLSRTYSRTVKGPTWQ
jgi:hypothetical protein